MDDPNELNVKLQDLVARLETLNRQLEDRKAARASQAEGFDRYCRAVTAELRFAAAMLRGQKEATRSRISSSNATLFEAVFAVLQREEGVVSIGQPFALDGKPRALKVDVVSEQGSKWIKVKAMNSKSIIDVHEGRGRYGERSVIELAADYLRCASQNVVNFGVPKVEFAFTDLPGIHQPILRQLMSAGILVASPEQASAGTGPAIAASPPGPLPPLEDDGSDEEGGVYGYSLPPPIGTHASAVDPLTVNTVNLDVTALVALASELTHGGCVKAFPRHPVLQRQAEDERKRPVMAGLQGFLEGKELIVCDRAVQDFLEIIAIVAGPVEKTRGMDLVARCRRVSDQPSATARSLPTTRRIKERQKVIFGTGDALHAITLTANVSFVRAAQEQGVHFAVYTHPSRALTEVKGEWPT